MVVLYCYGGGCSTSITDSKFDTNHATQSGGGIFGSQAILNVENSQFINNSADLTSGTGGAISMWYIGHAPLTTEISHSTFTENEASRMVVLCCY